MRLQEAAVLDRRMNKWNLARQVKDLPRISVAEPSAPRSKNLFGHTMMRERIAESQARPQFNLLPTADLSSQTMEARRVPGLYFIGEVVDVRQPGGYNFQWAWASAFAAGQVV